MAKKREKVMIDVYFTVTYSHLVELNVPVGTSPSKLRQLAREECFHDVIGHAESAFEAVSGCYLSESLKCGKVDVLSPMYV